jgi:2-oxo-4-hydroxy-4-carboxy-5-ureidoimidazoline decarboxylase
MNATLGNWNALSPPDAAREILPCCGSLAWAEAMVAARPFLEESVLFATSDRIWCSLPVEDWLEAFRSHPRIGESRAQSPAGARSASWSAAEQRRVSDIGDDLKFALADANRAYEQRFGRIFIVCAAGKSAAEILEILARRLQNDEATELQASAEEQRQIICVRLKKWLDAGVESNA